MRIFIVCFVAWFIAQVTKVIVNSVKYFIDRKKGKTSKKVTLETLFKLGGMPSSHTATVISLCTCIGCLAGWDSHIFAVAGVFAFITMFDAIKVRYPLGILTDAFNRIQKKVMGEEVKDVKKVEGHTLAEVACGFILGATVALCIMKFTPLFPEYVSIFEKFPNIF